jgi:hypothetical protein
MANINKSYHDFFSRVIVPSVVYGERAIRSRKPSSQLDAQIYSVVNYLHGLVLQLHNRLFGCTVRPGCESKECW